MQQKKVNGYTPKYPKKLLKGAALTAAAVMAINGSACRTAGVPLLPDEPDLAGDVYIDDLQPDETPGAPIVDDTPEQELGGEPLPDTEIDGQEDADAETHTRGGEPALQGKIIVPEETENP